MYNCIDILGRKNLHWQAHYLATLVKTISGLLRTIVLGLQQLMTNDLCFSKQHGKCFYCMIITYSQDTVHEAYRASIFFILKNNANNGTDLTHAHLC